MPLKTEIATKGVSKDLKKAIYKATASEKEFEYFHDSFKKLTHEEIQKVLDYWFNLGLISITNRDCLKEVC